MKVLVTGGTGYIGSHTVVELLAAAHEAVIVDNLSNSSAAVLGQLERITGQRTPFIKVDLADAQATVRALAEVSFDAIIHFAGLKAVGESVGQPSRYYRNNLTSLLTAIHLAAERGTSGFIFSSSATVYAPSRHMPIDESAPLGATNPYGMTKQMGEQILRDVAAASHLNDTILLRYFNPVGAHDSGLIGESPVGTPNNLMPFVAQVAMGRQPEVRVFGDDYDTADGTGVRDYLHVVDLAKAHVAAINSLQPVNRVRAYNLGTGRGYSVLEMIRAFELASGRDIPYSVHPRRAGDLATCFADPSLAATELGWRAVRDVHAMCADTWRWQQAYPDGLR
jgi:UDP-glucose 4-epimerase